MSDLSVALCYALPRSIIHFLVFETRVISCPTYFYFLGIAQLLLLRYDILKIFFKRSLKFDINLACSTIKISRAYVLFLVGRIVLSGS